MVIMKKINIFTPKHALSYGLLMLFFNFHEIGSLLSEFFVSLMYEDH